MKLRRIVVAAVAAASLMVAAGVVVSFLPTKSGHSVAQTVLGGVPTPRGGGSVATPPAISRATPGAAAPNPKKQDNSLIAGVGNGGSEQIPTATATPYRLHPTAVPSAIEADDVVVAPNSKVAAKSVKTAEGTTQVLIDATTTSKPADTVAYYQRVFAALGMTGQSLPAVGGGTAIAFSKDTTTVTLTVSAHDKGSSYLIHGVLRTGA